MTYVCSWWRHAYDSRLSEEEREQQRQQHAEQKVSIRGNLSEGVSKKYQDEKRREAERREQQR